MNRPTQFSLRTLLVNVAVIAMIVGLTFSVPVSVALPSLVIGVQLAITAVIVVIVYCRGALRAFAIGVIVPLSIAVLGSAQYLPVVINWRTVSLPEDNPVNAIILGDANDTPENIRAYLGVSALVALFAGYLGVVLQIVIEKRSFAGSLYTKPERDCKGDR